MIFAPNPEETESYLYHTGTNVLTYLIMIFLNILIMDWFKEKDFFICTRVADPDRL